MSEEQPSKSASCLRDDFTDDRQIFDPRRERCEHVLDDVPRGQRHKIKAGFAEVLQAVAAVFVGNESDAVK